MNYMYERFYDIYENHKDEVKDAIKRIIRMGFIAKNEGIFAMEVFVVEEDANYPEKRFVERIAGYLSDAADWEVVESFLLNHIYMMNDPKKQYLCLIYKQCMELLRTGKFTYFVKACICSLIPERYQLEVSEYVSSLLDEEYTKEDEKKNEQIEAAYEKLDVRIPLALKKEMDLFEEMAGLRADNAYTQKWLRFMDGNDVYNLLFMGSPAFKEVILSNMSSRLKLLAKGEVLKIAEHLNSDSENVMRLSIEKATNVLNQI